MEIVRFVNEDEIEGIMPSTTIMNPGVLQIIRDLQMRILRDETENEILTNSG